ncbi:FkbM family methyltransferase [Yeosuana sp. MJ-SS3]|uniref:FkbM family methyltransferase n=1 Tax=Gilvirhabdus luticola TaxID=3079858 RepID=A0ABU3U4X8_9FLAO|nr:FkbM family methyltransferase [Yeosuana sp. MJ-SS3]MDU8885460.1 FkbM family methyltransferase [Yeosuana sp. MJ-SS3]
MSWLLIKFYGTIPNKFRNYIGNISWLRFIRDIVLKKHGVYREASAFVSRTYVNYDVNFKFFASIKDVSKAVDSGIENKVLNNSIKLMNDYKKQQDDCIIIDVGANFGYLSLVWGTSLCQNNGKVYAFEPNINVCHSFIKSININNLKKIIKIENKAVGSENGNVDLFINNTTSNLIKEETSSIVKTQIDVVTLDSYCIENNIHRCDLIKIDVDGIEYDILKGSIHTLKKFKPIFIIETNQDERIIEFFNESNYLVFDMDLNPYHPNAELPLNIFCIPNKIS